MDLASYRAILEAEILFILKFKINPYEFFDKMSYLDLEVILDQISGRLIEENKEQNKNNNKFIKSLVAIRDILNSMNLPESR